MEEFFDVYIFNYNSQIATKKKKKKKEALRRIGTSVYRPFEILLD